jgi:hypothetical protein
MIIALILYKPTMSNNYEIYEDYISLNEEKEIDSCLVVCFEEVDADEYAVNENNGIDTRLFVTYDHSTKMYILNGKRQDIISKKGRNKTNLKPFVFCASESSDIVEFVLLTFGQKNLMNYILYNYNNLPEDACDMTYEFMESNIDRRYEIAAFDNIWVRRNLVQRLCRLTKNLYN